MSSRHKHTLTTDHRHKQEALHLVISYSLHFVAQCHYSAIKRDRGDADAIADDGGPRVSRVS
jgi:hypothetical protein